ncbi:CTP synthase [Arcanobacterium canis]
MDIISRSYGNSRPVRHIFVTGGVASSLGKGITAASLGSLLKARGAKVAMQKLDPYVNVDPGTMNPFQHGEVFVTDDGAETDLDIGHYERFLDEAFTGDANATTGQVYQNVLRRERAGEYLGECVQVIPHITNEIISRMRAQAEVDGDRPDVVITEIGGTVGDIESQPFLEAARQIRQKIGRDNCFFIHVSLVPYLAAGGELKTKPTQHSVAQLRQVGIQPDAVVLRCDHPLPASVKSKIALMCDVDDMGVIECQDASSIYEVPVTLFNEGLDSYVARQLDLPTHDVEWDSWNGLLERVRSPKHRVRVALVGKYIDLKDAYLSVVEALHAGGFVHWADVEIVWVPADSCETLDGAHAHLADVDAVLIPGGFGVRGLDGKVGALRYAREHQIPTLGICLGLQSMVIEAARNLLGLDTASSTEFDPETPDPVISTIDEQKQFVDGGDLGGTMRLGSYPAVLVDGSLVAQVYGTTSVAERHRHRYEYNQAYRDRLEAVGLKVSGTSPDGSLVEYVELDRALHPYYIATQAHPEFTSRPTHANPLFAGLIKAAIEKKNA